MLLPNQRPQPFSPLTIIINTLTFESPKLDLPVGGSHGVVDSIQDSESCDPSSNLGGTLPFS